MNQRGSLLGEFAFLVPLVVIAVMVTMQLMLLLSQRSQNHALADRVAFVAATGGIAMARLEAAKYQTSYADISSIEISKVGELVQVNLNSTANLLLPQLRFNYQLKVLLPAEP
jgi:hypothetical protein